MTHYFGKYLFSNTWNSGCEFLALAYLQFDYTEHFLFCWVLNVYLLLRNLKERVSFLNLSLNFFGILLHYNLCKISPIESAETFIVRVSHMVHVCKCFIHIWNDCVNIFIKFISHIKSFDFGNCILQNFHVINLLVIVPYGKRVKFYSCTHQLLHVMKENSF